MSKRLVLVFLVAGVLPGFTVAAVYRCPDGNYQDKPCDKGGGQAVDTERGAAVSVPPEGPGAALNGKESCEPLVRMRAELVEQQRIGAGRKRMEKLDRARRDLDTLIVVRKCER